MESKEYTGCIGIHICWLGKVRLMQRRKAGARGGKYWVEFDFMKHTVKSPEYKKEVAEAIYEFVIEALKIIL